MKNKKKKPDKPTEPYGYISFGKNGSVKKCMTNLSSDKQTQEEEVIGIFLESIKKLKPSFKINGLNHLPEADNDFMIGTSLGPITIELTELVDRKYTYKISKEQYRKGGHDAYIQKECWSIPLAIDQKSLDFAIKNCIEAKLSKNYSKPANGEFWLVIFSTSTFYPMEYSSGVKKMCSTGLQIARIYLHSLSSIVFDQIWYTNLLTNPVQIWTIR